MSFSTLQYTAAARAGASYDAQITPSLTTVFTPPSECSTPLMFLADCVNQSECYGSFMPLLYIVFQGNAASLKSIQCLPRTTVFSDGYTDGVYDYDPGLYCPDGMTTDTSIGSVFLCCPSGLSYYGGQEACTTTITQGSFFAGLSNDNEGTVGTVVTVSDNMTVYAAARPVYLTQKSSAVSPTFGDIPTVSTTIVKDTSDPTETSTPGGSSLVETISHSTECRGRCRTTTSDTSEPVETSTAGELSSVATISNGTECLERCQTAALPPNHDDPDPFESSSHRGLKVGASVGGVVVIVLLVIGYILLTRYRRKRLVPPTDSGVEVVRQIYQKKLLPELPVSEPRAELEGTPGEGRGAGIYVRKPELEGTAGIPGVVGVYVKKKFELEANHSGVTNSALGTGAGTTTTTTTKSPYESPIISPSLTRYFVPTSSAV
ncbi:hypothetical protein F5X98DRAFT_369647 [Xylaria grammica]|nr:hypothetical protein F5X98DRAFT_369647 [Xylaria grammica]